MTEKRGKRVETMDGINFPIVTANFHKEQTHTLSEKNSV